VLNGSIRSSFGIMRTKVTLSRAILNVKPCLFLLMHAPSRIASRLLARFLTFDSYCNQSRAVTRRDSTARVRNRNVSEGMSRLWLPFYSFARNACSNVLYNPVLAIRTNTFRRVNRAGRNERIATTSSTTSPKGQGAVGRSVNQSIRFIRARASADAYLPETT